jgi:hypothetical protein
MKCEYFSKTYHHTTYQDPVLNDSSVSPTPKCSENRHVDVIEVTKLKIT